MLFCQECCSSLSKAAAQVWTPNTWGSCLLFLRCSCLCLRQVYSVRFQLGEEAYVFGSCLAVSHYSLGPECHSIPCPDLVTSVLRPLSSSLALTTMPCFWECVQGPVALQICPWCCWTQRGSRSRPEEGIAPTPSPRAAGIHRRGSAVCRGGCLIV